MISLLVAALDAQPAVAETVFKLWQGAKASGWMFLSVNSDTLSTTRSANSVGKNPRIWIRYDYVTPESLGDISALTTIELVEADCAEMASKSLAYTNYSGRGMTGENRSLTPPGTWQYSPPGSFGYLAIERACGREPADSKAREINK